MTQPDYVHVIYIRADPQRIWEALTSPDETEKFWFGERCQADWSQGAQMRFANADNSRGFFGEVLETDPPKRLVFTFRHNSAAEHPEGPSVVTYELEEADGRTKLTVTHARFHEDGELRRSISGGWPLVLSSLKSYLETGEPLAA
ncbi:MAG TPA: SRPBCC family protein [Caulobacteraceae bacterium]